MAAETDPHKSSEITKNLLPATLQLIDTYASFTRCGDPHSLKDPCVCVYPFLVCGLCVFPLVQDVKGRQRSFSQLMSPRMSHFYNFTKSCASPALGCREARFF